MADIPFSLFHQTVEDHRLKYEEKNVANREH